MVTSVGFDCLVIPGASKQADSADLKGSEFCGRQLASLMSAMPRATICSKFTHRIINSIEFLKFQIILEISQKSLKLFYL